jgi:hypothetical protein
MRVARVLKPSIALCQASSNEGSQKMRPTKEGDETLVEMAQRYDTLAVVQIAS